MDEFSELVHPIISLGCQRLNYTLFDQTALHDLEGTKCPAFKNIHRHLAFLRSFSVAVLWKFVTYVHLVHLGPCSAALHVCCLFEFETRCSWRGKTEFSDFTPGRIILLISIFPHNFFLNGNFCLTAFRLFNTTLRNHLVNKFRCGESKARVASMQEIISFSGFK